MAYLIGLDSFLYIINSTLFHFSIYTQHTTLTTHTGKYSQYARPVKETAGSDVRRRDAGQGKTDKELGFINISIFDAYLVTQLCKSLTKMSGNHH